ncbi:MAG TPA: hypothetical protein VK119_11955 [Bacillota bacterium]|nr:hypothetical protein [Bacillota bacterium]
MLLNRAFRIFVQFLLLIAGTLLADGYKNRLYFYWLSALIILFFILELYISKNEKINFELQEANHKISTLTILKSHNTNTLQISLFPKSVIYANKESEIDLYVTSSIPIDNVPQVKLLTNEEFEIKISNQIQHGKRFADNYEYILTNPLVDFKNNRYIHYRFYIVAKKHGSYELTVQVSDGKFEGKLVSTITAQKS